MEKKQKLQVHHKFSDLRNKVIGDSNVFIANSYYLTTNYMRVREKSKSPIVKEVIDTLISSSLAKEPEFVINAPKEVLKLLNNAFDKILSTGFFSELKKLVECYYVFGGAYCLVAKSDSVGVKIKALNPMEIGHEDGNIDNISNFCFYLKNKDNSDSNKWFMALDNKVYTFDKGNSRLGKEIGEDYPFIKKPLVALFNSCRYSNEYFNVSPLYNYIEDLLELNVLYDKRLFLREFVSKVEGFTDGNLDKIKEMFESKDSVNVQSVFDLGSQRKAKSNGVEFLDKSFFLQALQVLETSVDKLENRIKEGTGVLAIENISEPVANQSATASLVQINTINLKLKHHLSSIELAIASVYKKALMSLASNIPFLEKINGKELSVIQRQKLQEEITIDIGNINYIDANFKKAARLEGINTISSELLQIVSGQLGADPSIQLSMLKLLQHKATILDVDKVVIDTVAEYIKSITKARDVMMEQVKQQGQQVANDEPSKEQQILQQASLEKIIEETNKLKLQNMQLQQSIGLENQEVALKQQQVEIEEREQSLQEKREVRLQEEKALKQEKEINRGI